MLIGLTGYARSGKDSVADILVREHGFTRYALADGVRDLALKINPLIESEWSPEVASLGSLVDHYGWERIKLGEWASSARRVLQDIGTGAREVLGEDVWIEALSCKLKEAGRGRWYYGGLPDVKVVITDVRFANEAEWVRNVGGEVWRVERPGVGPANGHVSERLEFGADRSIANSRDLGYLVDRVRFSLEAR